MKTVLFARVSTKDQAEDGYSLDSQRKLLDNYGAQRSLFITRRFIVPESASGKQERKQFNEMLKFLYENPEVKIVLCEKVDRVSRNFKDAEKINDWLNEDEERQIHFVKQNLIIHKNARSHERFQWDIYLVVAKQQINNLSEETKKGLTEKASQNCYPGNFKRGYHTVGESGHKLWVIDKTEASEAPFIKKAFELYDTGEFTTHTLGKHLLKEGWRAKTGGPVTKSSMHKMLKDRFYCGEFVWNKKPYPNANHDALISKELFERVQARIEKKLTGKSKKNSFLLSGLMKCAECGRSICAEVQKGHNYYKCTRYETNCTQKSYTREEDLEKQIVKDLGKFKVTNPRLAGWIKDALKESHADEAQYHNCVLGELQGRHTRTQQRIDTLYDEKIDGNITEDFYQKKLEQYSQEIDEIIASIQRHKKANVSYIELGSSIIDLTQRAEELYVEKATPEKKRKLLSVIYASLLVQNKVISPVYNPAFQFILDKINTLNQEEVTFEPKTSSNKAVVLQTEQNSDTWLASLSQNGARSSPARTFSILLAYYFDGL